MVQCDHQNGRTRERDVICFAASSPFMRGQHDNIELFFLEFSNRFQSIGSLIANFPSILRFVQRS